MIRSLGPIARPDSCDFIGVTGKFRTAMCSGEEPPPPPRAQVEAQTP